ncbi:MAG: hypothetical protein AB8F26_05590 [Phycisphaerales bacterium]
MSQFGMQMPGGGRSSGPTPDVYTALMCVGTVCMIAAVALLWFAGSKIAPDGMPLKVQDTDPATRIELPS